jgi:class 3 adenylate cyclase
VANEPATKVVAVIDLARYSDICKELEQHFGTEAVVTVNNQIRSLIHGALAEADLDVDQVPYKGTGDGAIVVLDNSKDASVFAENLHLAAEEHNRGKDVELAQRHFRVGVFTGPIILHPGKGRNRAIDFAGGVIGNAVRLEGACMTGEVLIDSETWANLPPELRKLYGPAEAVKGKRKEQFQAHRRKVAAPAPWDAEGKAPAAAKNASSSSSGEVIALHKRRLGHLEKQAAHFGARTPPEISMEIEDIKQILSELES